MSDFFADLEAELLDAARRRALRRRRLSLVLPRPAAGRLVASVGVLAVLVTVVVLLVAPRAGDRERATTPPAVPGCGATVDPRLSAAIPALRGPAGAAPPASLAGALEGGRIAPDAARVVGRATRVAGGGEDVTWWIVPASFPTDGRCGALTRACVIPVTDHPVGAPACATARDASLGASVIAGPYDGHVAVYGLVPARVASVQVSISGVSKTAVARNGVVGGVFVMPWHNGSGVDFAYAAAPDAPVVAVFNATTSRGLGTRTLARLGRQAFRPGPLATYVSQAVRRTQVLFAPGARDTAEAVRHVLRAGYVAPLDALDPLARDLLGSRHIDVVVVAGEDLARRG
jgi:hypothetical protein